MDTGASSARLRDSRSPRLHASTTPRLHDSRPPRLQVSRSPGLQASTTPGLQVSRSPRLQDSPPFPPVVPPSATPMPKNAPATSVGCRPIPWREPRGIVGIQQRGLLAAAFRFVEHPAQCVVAGFPPGDLHILAPSLARFSPGTRPGPALFQEGRCRLVLGGDVKVKSSRWYVLLALALIVGVAQPLMAQGLSGQIGGTVLDASESGDSWCDGQRKERRNPGNPRNGDGRRRPVYRHQYSGRTVRPAGQPRRVQILRAARPFRCRRPTAWRSRPSRWRLAASTEEVTVQAEALRVQTQSGERSATVTAAQIADVGLRGRDFMGTLKVLPGVIDTSARDAPGWGSVGGMTINGNDELQLLVRRCHQQGHRVELGQLRGAGARLDRRSEGAGLELPGRVRPQLRRHDRRRHQERHARGSAGRRRIFKRHEAFNENTWDRRRTCDAAKAHGRDVALLRHAPLPLRQHRRGRSVDRCSAGLAASTATATSCSSSSRRTCCRAPIRWACRTARCRRRSSGRATSRRRATTRAQLRNIRDPLSTGACNVNTGGPGCFAGQHHSGQPHQRRSAGDAEHVPAAECDRPDRHAAVQLPVRSRRSRSCAASRWCASTTTSGRAPRSTAARSSARKSTTAATAR